MGRSPVEAIIARFDDVAFGHEHGPSQHVVRKWAASPMLFFYTRSVPELEGMLPLIRRNADDIRSLTGLAWRVSRTRERASLVFGCCRRATSASSACPTTLPSRGSS